MWIYRPERFEGGTHPAQEFGLALFLCRFDRIVQKPETRALIERLPEHRKAIILQRDVFHAAVGRNENGIDAVERRRRGGPSVQRDFNLQAGAVREAFLQE